MPASPAYLPIPPPHPTHTHTHTHTHTRPSTHLLTHRFTNTSGTGLMSDDQGSVVSYVSPNGDHLTIVVETAQSNVTNALDIRLVGTVTPKPKPRP